MSQNLNSPNLNDLLKSLEVTEPKRDPKNEGEAVRAMIKAFTVEAEQIARHIENGGNYAVDGMKDQEQDRATLQAADRVGHLCDIFGKACAAIVFGYLTKYYVQTGRQSEIDALKKELDQDLQSFTASFEAIANGNVQ